MVAFGTETGNAEMLAEDISNVSSKYGIESSVHDLEDLSVDEIASSKMLIIVCSTWGEGDPPDNAQDIYDEVCNSDDSSMVDVHFAVLALGDTAFDMFCESGIEWDQLLED